MPSAAWKMGKASITGAAVATAANGIPSAVVAIQAALVAQHGDSTISAAQLEQAAVGPGLTAATTLAALAGGQTPDISTIIAAIKAAPADRA